MTNPKWKHWRKRRVSRAKRDARTCAHKRWYPSEEAAQAEIDRLTVVREAHVHTYRCPVCGRYHIGAIIPRQYQDY